MKTAQLVQTSLEFLTDRFPIEKMNVNSLVRTKEVPVHRMSWAYYLGGLALFLFLVQLVTGLMLMFYYEPTVSDAHASVERITEHIGGGALVRNLHTWSASAMIFAVVVHMLTAFAMKAFAKPREITWVSGVLLLLITFAFGFTGYLLPWHQIAVNATKVGLQSIEEAGAYLPGAMSAWPGALKELIQGEASVGQATLSRFYAIHVMVLPLAFFGVLSLHLLSVQLHGMSQGVDRPTGRTERFFPFFILKDAWLWGVVFLVLFVVALCLPFEAFFSYPLFEAYDAMGSTPDGIKPEWYFYFIYYPLELLPFWVIMLAQNAAIAVLLAAPWIFRKTSRRALGVITVAVATYLVVMTVFGQQIYEMFKGGA
ncbi:MAG TPA: cytochrome b N-terminal domain-containing protein [Candidatus Sumerlaeota bacterium]|mgnify:CR=1 FL=1|nr:MAG: Cytochrome bc complex cytochrome b subunit [candidate division BRC1 bacterium ADurb.BinA292]HOE97066.1 cytochrome b N-terminal domain-containing protein [Candidatus Sumerlaeota bacterium]HOR26921.1 cytochrome b N-terminal domain-containing protein [Candidatus Sumerlaeota bacterium]HPK03113.1 cytochrome b N-terminal domain-containing protein [Candidatus Sumerlaeota bacterium]